MQQTEEAKKQLMKENEERVKQQLEPYISEIAHLQNKVSISQ